MTSASSFLPAAATGGVAWTDPARQAAFHVWLGGIARTQAVLPATLRVASADASFRRYLRIDSVSGPSRIVMDAPPAHEDCRPFVQVAALLHGGGLRAPEVLAWDEPQGFMLLSDLGDTTYLAALRQMDLTQPQGQQAANTLYRAALDSLVRLQRIDAATVVPPYDEALLRRELELFPVWYVQRHRGLTLTDRQQADLARMFDLIVQACLAQPRVLVHRDFHSRNLMVPAEPGQPGLLDFQDAVHGPITYDLVSLLRDAYIDWDESVQIDWAVRWWEVARKAGLPVDADFGVVWRDFEWMGLQRHLKVLGIFARLAHRDGKHGYLDDIPLVWRYAHHVAMRYAVLAPLARLLEQVAGVDARSGFTF